MSLKPPDRGRCDCFPNMLEWSPFSLGPRPVPRRCMNLPVWIAREKKPGKDGQIGSMSLCWECAALAATIEDLRTGLAFSPINRSTVDVRETLYDPIRAVPHSEG